MTYDTRKNIWLIFVALVFAALAAWLATRWMQTRIDLADNGKLRLSNMVIAARDVPLGKRIEAADVRLVRATPTSIPPDAFRKSEDVIGKVSRSSVLAGEALINRRLSKHVGGSSLAAVLDPGMRAVTVRVDDVIGVGGFVLPETRSQHQVQFHIEIFKMVLMAGLKAALAYKKLNLDMIYLFHLMKLISH
jgi:pilus assembly protein CpaB